MVDKFPEEIFVSLEEPGTDDAFLNATLEIGTFASVGEKQKVGVYRLIETREVEAVVSSRKVD